MKIVFVSSEDFEKATKQIKSYKGNNYLIVFSSKNYDVTKKVLERQKINVLLINVSGRKDKMKQLDSGFDSVLARLTKKNEVSLGINLEEIFTSDSFKEKSDVIARIKQNIKLCSKYKIKVVFFAERRRDLYDLKALCLVLGMPTYLTKEIKFYNLNNIKN